MQRYNSHEFPSSVHISCAGQAFSRVDDLPLSQAAQWCSKWALVELRTVLETGQ